MIEDEAGPLALLGHGPVEEVEGDGGGGDVDDRRQGLAVDGDVLLLFGVECGRRGGFFEGEGAAGPSEVKLACGESRERLCSQGRSLPVAAPRVVT